MPLSVSWHTLLEEAEDLPASASLITPLSHKRFQITDTQESRIIIEFTDSGNSRPLQRDQFETLYRRIQDANGRFELDRIPPDAGPYVAVLTLHPRYEIDENANVILETEAPTSTQVIDEGGPDETERTEPDVSVYADALLLNRIERAERELEQWLVKHAEAGVSELVLVGILRDYGDRIEEYEYIPRSWGRAP